jgi:hypothetical protein
MLHLLLLFLLFGWPGLIIGLAGGCGHHHHHRHDG